MINKSVIKDYTCNVNFWLILLFGAAIGVFLIGMPKYVDDLSFLEFIIGWFREQNVSFPDEGGNIFKYGIPWSDIAHSWAEHWRYDNLRLGNILVFFFLLLPKWIGAGLCTLTWYYCMVSSLKLAKIDIRQSALVIVALVLWIFFLPWGNKMGSLVYQFNYVLGTGVALWFLNSLQHDGSKPILFISGFLTGAWQEAFSIPILTALAVLMIYDSKFRKGKFYYAMTGLLLGLLAIVVSQGTYLRITGYVHLEGEVLRSKVVYLIAYNLLYYIFLFILAYTAKIKKDRNIWLQPEILFCVISGLIPIFILMAVYAEPRVTWWTQIISIIGIVYVLNRYYKDYWERYRLSNLLWLMPVGIFAFAHIAVSDIFALKMRKTFSESVKQYLKHPDVPVFTEIYMVKDLPLVCLKMPDVLFYGGVHDFMPDILSNWTGKNNFRMIPKELHDVTVDSGKLLEGDGFREYQKRLVIDAEKMELADRMNLKFQADYGQGYREVAGHAFSFISEADGRKYYYVHLMSPWYLQHFGKIKGLKFSGQ